MSTEMQVQETGGKSLKTFLKSQSAMEALQAVATQSITPERIVRIVLAQAYKTPKLAQCEPATILTCLMDLSRLGLEPDGRNAHLIPYEDRKNGRTICQLQLDYKGIVTLAMRNGLVSHIHADVVCENDEFEYNLGEVVKHKIDFRRERGNIYAAYCVIRFKDGTQKTEVMSRKEIDGIRSRSKSRDNGPWVTDYNEMAKKTVFKRASKWIPLTPEAVDAMDVDNRDYGFSEYASDSDSEPKATITVSKPSLSDAIPKTKKKEQELEAEAEAKKESLTK